MWECSFQLTLPAFLGGGEAARTASRLKPSSEDSRSIHRRVNESDPLLESHENGVPQDAKGKEAINWLLAGDEDQVFDALLHLDRVRPDLVQRFWIETGWAKEAGGGPGALPSLRFLPHEQQHVSVSSTKLKPPPSLSQKSPKPPKNATLLSLAKNGGKVPPVVQFSSRIYYANEGVPDALLEVIRFGDLSGTSVVTFKTKSGSAKEGEKFLKTEGKVVFETNENRKTILVPLIADDRWDTSTEFEVWLQEEGLYGAMLSSRLCHARVKIIDDDVFPSNLYGTEIKNHQLHTVPKLRLLMEYIKFNLTFKKIKERTVKIVALDGLHNMFFLIHLMVNVYLVDYVLNPESSSANLVFVHSKQASLLLIVIYLVLPFGLLHFLEHRKKSNFGIGGTSRSVLQVSLMRKFLEIDHSSRKDLTHTDLVTAMTSDATDLVSGGYTAFLAMLKEFGELAVMLVYQFIAPPIFGKPFSAMGLMPVIVFPPIMLFWVRLRTPMTTECLNHRTHAYKMMLHVVNEAVANFELIAGFRQRVHFTEEYEHEVKDYNTAARETNIVLNNNSYFALWLSVLVVASWTLVGGFSVLQGSLSLGMFLTNVNIFQKIGHSWFKIYDLFMEMNMVVPCLERITRLMNLPTDLNIQNDLCCDFHARALSYQLKAAASGGSTEHPYVDNMPIVIGNFQFVYHTKGIVEELGTIPDVLTRRLNFKNILELEQGALVCLIGHAGSGKTTLLKVLSGSIYADPASLSILNAGRNRRKAVTNVNMRGESAAQGGRLFVPLHLGIVHCDPTNTMFTVGTLKEQLLFGADGPVEEQERRMKAICKRVGLTQDVIDMIELSLPWEDVLTVAQSQLVNIARALIADPEVLCLQQPTGKFSEYYHHHIAHTLREHCEERGLERDPDERFLRRPRTCIMTTASCTDVEIADYIILVKEDGALEVLDHLDGGTALEDDDHPHLRSAARKTLFRQITGETTFGDTPTDSSRLRKSRSEHDQRRSKAILQLDNPEFSHMDEEYDKDKQREPAELGVSTERMRVLAELGAAGARRA